MDSILEPPQPKPAPLEYPLLCPNCQRPLPLVCRAPATYPKEAAGVCPRCDLRVKVSGPGVPALLDAPQPIKVYLDWMVQDRDIEASLLDAYTFGTLWNGAATPYFTREQADALVKRTLERSPGDLAAYDPARDEYVFCPADARADPIQAFEATERFGAIERGGLRVYGIGAYAWMWSVHDPGEDKLLACASCATLLAPPKTLPGSALACRNVGCRRYDPTG